MSVPAHRGRLNRFLWDHAFREMTVTRLMDQTSIGRSALYVYVRDMGRLAGVLLGKVQATLDQAISPWVAGVGEPVATMYESIRGEVQACVRIGPIMRAVAKAALSRPPGFDNGASQGHRMSRAGAK